MSASVWKGKTLGVIGGGNMAEALVRGVLDSGLIGAAHIAVYDVLPERLAVFSGLGCAAAKSPQKVLAADVVLLATKPQTLAAALKGLAARDAQVFVSIAAGIPTGRIEEWLPGARVIRVMPNTPLMVGAGMSALAAGARADAGDMRLAVALFACCGDAVEVPENLLDAVTAVSGSGPAYVFRFAEAMMAGGEALGLDAALARRLTVATLRGAAAMLARDGADAAELRKQVTSPGGTTAAALAVFEQHDIMGTAAAALAAARDRSVELGRGQ